MTEIGSRPFLTQNLMLILNLKSEFRKNLKKSQKPKFQKRVLGHFVFDAQPHNLKMVELRKMTIVDRKIKKKNAPFQWEKWTK